MYRWVASGGSCIGHRERLQIPSLLMESVRRVLGAPAGLEAPPRPQGGTCRSRTYLGPGGNPGPRPASGPGLRSGRRWAGVLGGEQCLSRRPSRAPRPPTAPPPLPRSQPRGPRSRRPRFSCARVPPAPPAASHHTYRASAPPPCGSRNRRPLPRQEFRAALPDPPL